MDDKNVSKKHVALAAAALLLIGIFVFFFPHDLSNLDKLNTTDGVVSNIETSLKQSNFTIELVSSSIRFKGRSSRKTLSKIKDINEGDSIRIWGEPYRGFLGVLFPNDRLVGQVTDAKQALILSHGEAEKFVEGQKLSARVLGLFLIVASILFPFIFPKLQGIISDQ